MKISSQNEQITQLKDKIQSFEDMPKSTPSASNSHQESGFNLSKQDQVAISEWVGAWTKSSMEAKFTELHGGSGGSIPNFYYFYQRNKLGISDPPKYP